MLVQVLVGVQLPPADVAEWSGIINTMGSDEFTFTELPEEARAVFKQFIQ